MNRARRLAALALCAAIGFPSAAFPACSRSDATGKWMGIASLFPTGGDAFWAICRLVVRPTGSIRDTSCIDSSGDDAPLTRGRISLSDGPSCLFFARFRLGANRQEMQMVMALDKNTMTGVGLGPNGPFVLDLIRVDALPRSRNPGPFGSMSEE